MQLTSSNKCSLFLRQGNSLVNKTKRKCLVNNKKMAPCLHILNMLSVFLTQWFIFFYCSWVTIRSRKSSALNFGGIVMGLIFFIFSKKTFLVLYYKYGNLGHSKTPSNHFGHKLHKPPQLEKNTNQHPAVVAKRSKWHVLYCLIFFTAIIILFIASFI